MRSFTKEHPFTSFIIILVIFTALLASVDLKITQTGVDLFNIYFMQLAPGLAAVMLWGLLRGKAGLCWLLRKLTLWKIKSDVYYLSIALPLCLAVINGAFGGFVINSIACTAFIGIAIGCIGEELGWRGFLLPGLLCRFSPLKSSLILGAIWELWHLPLRFLMLYQGDIPLFIVSYLLFAASTLSLSVLLTSVYYHAKGSLVPSILIHTINNILTVLLSPLQMSFAHILAFTAGMVILTFLIVYRYGLMSWTEDEVCRVVS